MSHRLTLTLFVIYVFALFWIVVLKFNMPSSYMGNTGGVNLIPYARPMILNGKVDYGEMILNGIVFLPLGLYSGVLLEKWSVLKKTILFALTSLVCEVLQYVFKVGNFDITDILNNTIGALVGLMIFWSFKTIARNDIRAERIVNAIGITGTLFIAIGLLLLKINHLWIFRMDLLKH